jgi:hypothetical protein
MERKIYLLVFDPYKTNADSLHTIITTMPYTREWWHYIGSAYLIVSTAAAVDIQNYINSRWNGFFLTMEVNKRNAGGWLPIEAWNWINSRR